MTGPEDEWPTLVRLPLLPSPQELDELRIERRRLEDELMAAVTAAIDNVKDAAAAHVHTADAVDQAVRHAIAAGATWSEIGRALGMSRQAVTKRWGTPS